MDVITKEINQKSTSMSAHFEIDVLAHLIVAIVRHFDAILASSPGSFDRRLFRIHCKYKTSAKRQPS